jgi:hypothetical protein
MKLVLTLLARNEADVVDAQIAFHLNAGVDVVVATDNRSDDGTTEILERYESTGKLILFREPGDDMRQDEWVTRMARFAATELAADWVINSDADEFWWPRGGSLKDVVAVVPARYGVIRGCWRHFVPRPGDDEPFSERMTVRLCKPAFPGDKTTIYHAHQKAAHRARPDIEIERGNHNADAPGLEPLRGWHPIEVLHFSIRSHEQVRTKSRGGWLRSDDYDPPAHRLELHAALDRGDSQSFYRAHLVDDEMLERGLDDGTFEVDTRLRDALRLLRTADGGYRIPRAHSEAGLSFEPPDLVETAAYAGESAVLAAIDGIVRAEDRVHALARRIDALEGTQLGSLATRASRLIPGRRLARR